MQVVISATGLFSLRRRILHRLANQSGGQLTLCNQSDSIGLITRRACGVEERQMSGKATLRVNQPRPIDFNPRLFGRINSAECLSCPDGLQAPPSSDGSWDRAASCMWEADFSPDPRGVTERPSRVAGRAPRARLGDRVPLPR